MNFYSVCSSTIYSFANPVHTAGRTRNRRIFVQGYKGRQILNVYICRILCQNLFAFLIISGLFVIVCACCCRFVCFVIGRIIKVNEIIGSSAFESGQQRRCSQTGCVYANYGRFVITVGINIRQPALPFDQLDIGSYTDLL